MSRSRDLSSLKRKPARYEPYDRILIVCEGSKTEPNYLSEFIAYNQLSSANVKITGEGGSAPNSVVQYAIELFEIDQDYNAVFCVFDRDGHTTFDAALRTIRDKKLIRRSGRKNIGTADFNAITSTPCFEFWILLHFTYTTASMQRFSNVEPALKAIPQLASYNKGSKGIYEVTHKYLNAALINADRANKAAEDAGTDNPTTKMPLLIRHLQSLKK